MKAFRISTRSWSVILFVLGFGFLGLAAWYGGLLRPERPPFASHWGVDAARVPPWPRWCCKPPVSDGQGVSLQRDERRNLVVVLRSKQPSLRISQYPDGLVFDNDGNLLVEDRRRGTWKSIANTPDILSADNRLYVAGVDGEWQEFSIPDGFAKDLPVGVTRLASSRADSLLHTMERHARTLGVADLADYLGDLRARDDVPTPIEVPAPIEPDGMDAGGADANWPDAPWPRTARRDRLDGSSNRGSSASPDQRRSIDRDQETGKPAAAPLRVPVSPPSKDDRRCRAVPRADLPKNVLAFNTSFLSSTPFNRSSLAPWRNTPSSSMSSSIGSMPSTG